MTQKTYRGLHKVSIKSCQRTAEPKKKSHFFLDFLMRFGPPLMDKTKQKECYKITSTTISTVP